MVENESVLVVLKPVVGAFVVLKTVVGALVVFGR